MRRHSCRMPFGPWPAGAWAGLLQSFGVSVALATFLFGASAHAQPFQLPTANRALFEPGGEEKFFVGTVGKPWTSGTFGCVRSDGWQMHEGLDIRSVQHDRRGEPLDPVLAAADGVVAYVSRRAGLSTYGKYMMVRHQIDGLEVFSLYAHLSDIFAGVREGLPVKAGQAIGVMGRTTSARSRISKDRAHLHFELVLLVNERFPTWFRQTHPQDRNDHGFWNGQNLVGVDPRAVFLQQRAQGPRFSLLQLVRGQTELCRVLVRRTDFPWLRRYPALVTPNPTLGKQPIAGYELALNFNGLPFQITPRGASEFKGSARYQVVSVNAAEQQKNPCRRLVTQQGRGWVLTSRGQAWLDQLTF